MPFFLAAFAALTVAAQPGSSLGSCQSPTLCNGEAMARVAARLQAARGGDQPPVHILQIGDSHTAGDNITNGLRTRLQARFGHGGRGVLAAGRPYSGYLTWGVTASESGGWTTNALFGSRWNPNGPALGLSGFTRTARAAGETLAVRTDTPDHDFDRMVVCAATGPGAGAVSLRIGAEEQNWTLDAPARGAACRTLESAAPVSSASITTLDGGIVSITSFATFRRRGGAVVSNVGVVGAQLVHLTRGDDSVVREELRAYRPDLVVLAFGTNEGFGASGSAAGYEGALRSTVSRIRATLGPETPIMLLGAPDGASRGARSGTSCGSGWTVPAQLGEVRGVQRRLARELNLAFWDWEQAMGGTCAAGRWMAQGLMRGDGVHFTRDGGDRVGAAIFADLGLVPAPRPEQAAPPFEHADPRQEPIRSDRRRP